MDPYDNRLVPAAVGLVNTGATCYFNAFLQALVGCSAFVRAAVTNSHLLSATRTGRALLEFLQALGLASGLSAGRLSDPAGGSAHILASLVADLAERRPHVRFGQGQESASEALVHFLDMLEPAAEQTGAGPGSASPLTDLFLHRSTCSVFCLSCRQVASLTKDHAVTFHLFHFDLIEPPATPAEFVRAMSRHVSALEDYRCEKCHRASHALRMYTLTMVPEILFCAFNLYTDYGLRRAHWFPEHMEFPGSAPGELLRYRLVGQVEHSGTLHSGHYWARCLRAGERVYALNDQSAAPSGFAPTPATYLIVYHFEATRAGTVGEWESLARPAAKAPRGAQKDIPRGCPPA